MSLNPNIATDAIYFLSRVTPSGHHEADILLGVINHLQSVARSSESLTKDATRSHYDSRNSRT